MKLRTLSRLIGIGLLTAASGALYAAPFAYTLNTGARTISVIDTANNTVVGTPIAIPRAAAAGTNGPRDVALNAAGTRLYIADDDDNEVEVFTLADPSFPIRTTPISLAGEGNAGANALAFRPGSPNTLYVAGGNGTLEIVDTSANGGAGAVVTGSAIQTGGGAERVIFNNTGTRAYVTNRGDNNITAINAAATPPVALPVATTGTIGNANTLGPLDLAYDAATNRLFVANIDDRVPAPAGGNQGNVQVFAINPGTDVATEATGSPIAIPVASLPPGSTNFRPGSVTISPVEARVYVANQFADNVFAFNTAVLSNTPVETLDVAAGGSDPHIPAFTSTGRLFIPNEGLDRVELFTTTPGADAEVLPPAALPAGPPLAGVRRIVINAATAATASGTLQFNPTTATVNEAAGTVSLTVTRSGDASGAASATATPTDGTAVGTSDFTATPITVSFAAGAATATVAVPITNDTAVESAETFTVVLSAPTGAVLGANRTATVTITDDDTAGGGATPPANNGGGGGCALSPSAALDFSLPLMLLAGLLYIFRRRVGKLGK